MAQHYDQLHLHTHKRQSGLPGLPMPARFPKYAARDQVIAYLEDYAAHHRIVPRFGTPAARITRPDKWLVETPGEAFTTANVIIASGIAGWPQRADWSGKDSFGGRLHHSSEYANATPFAGQRVLVVGFGNSGGEIAIDLANTGIDVSISVRSPVNILPRELFGMSMMNWAILQRPLPYRLMGFNTPLLRLVIGDLAKLGLRKSPKGPLAQTIEPQDPGARHRHGRAIRQGKIGFRRHQASRERWIRRRRDGVVHPPSSKRPATDPTCDRCPRSLGY